MPRYTATNQTTGEKVTFIWNNPKPPTADDIERIADDQRQARITARQSIQSMQPSFTQRLKAGFESASQDPWYERPITAPVGAIAAALEPITGGKEADAMNALGLNQPWHPIDSASDVVSGMKQMVTGEGKEANPRTAGLAKTIRGTMGVVGPPLTALGYAAAPVSTGIGMLSGGLSSKAADAALPEDTSPEVRELVETGAGVLGGSIGGAAAHRAGIAIRSRFAKTPPPPVTPPFPPEAQKVLPPASTVPPPPRTGVNFADTSGVNFSETQPQGPPDYSRRLIDEPQVVSPSDSRTVPFNGGPPVAPPTQGLPPAQPQALLPERGEPIQQPSIAFRMPPAGTFQNAMETEAAFGPNGTRALPPPAPAQDLVSVKRPEPQSPSEVSTVSTPPVSPSAGGGTGAGPQPPAPIVPALRKGPGVRSQGEQIPPVAPPAPPEPQAAPQVQSPADIARAALAQASKPQAVPPTPRKYVPPAPPMGPTTPPVKPPVQATPQAELPKVEPPVQTPQPQAQAPTVKSPMDIAKAALGKAAEPEGESQLPPPQVKKAMGNNDVLNFLKGRKNVTLSEIQNKTGVSLGDLKSILSDLYKRGLVERSGKYVNYKALPGEELPSTEPPPAAPQAAPPSPQIPKAETPPVGGSSGRQKSIEGLQAALKEATNNGDEEYAKVLQNHIDAEQKNLKLERGSAKDQQLLSQIDNTTRRMDELEDKEGKGSITPEEFDELKSLYRTLNDLEKKRDYALKTDEEKFGPRVANLRSVHAEGQLSKLSHGDLSKRAKAEYGVDSMSKMTPEQLSDFEEKLKTERMEREAEIQELEEKEVDGSITPEEKNRLSNFWKDETGTSSMMRGLQNVASILSSKGPGKGTARKLFFQSGETTLRKEGGADLAFDIRNARTEGEKLAGNLVADYHNNIKGLNDAEFKSFMDVIQGTGRAINQKVAQAAQTENARLTQIQGRLGTRKVNMNIDPVNSPRTDKALLSDFYTDAAKKIEEFNQLGPRKYGIPQEVRDQIDQIRAKGGDYKTASRIAKAYFNPDSLDQAEQAIWEKMANFEAATKLGMSVISNATQPVNASLVSGNMTFLKAIAKYIQNPEAAKDLALRAGSTLSSVTHESQMSSGVAPKTFSGKMLEMTGFSPVEVHNRVVASMVGAEHAVNMFKRLKANPNDSYARRHLSYWLGLDPDVLKGQQKLTMDQVLTAAHTMSDRTQFRTTPLEVPPTWGSSLPAKMMTLFKSFAFNQAKFMKDVTVNEIKAGNIRPLIPLLTTVPMVGYLADHAKDILADRKQAQTFWENVIGAYTAVGGVGIISDLAARAAAGQLAEAVAGPIVADATEFVQSLFKGAQRRTNKYEPTAKFVTRNIPVVGRPLSNTLFPVKEPRGSGGSVRGNLPGLSRQVRLPGAP